MMKMKKFHSPKTKQCFVNKPVLICTVILLLISGCETTQPYGSFIRNPSPVFSQHSKVMADDVADQIGRLYPAASTQLDLRHNVNDAFGQALLNKLRNEGFAVLESANQKDYSLTSVNLLDSTEEPSNSPDMEETAQNNGVTLRYIIDQSGDLYHVSILVEDQQLTRAFIAQSGKIQPAGSWVRKE